MSEKKFPVPEPTYLRKSIESLLEKGYSYADILYAAADMLVGYPEAHQKKKDDCSESDSDSDETKIWCFRESREVPCFRGKCANWNAGCRGCMFVPSDLDAEVTRIWCFREAREMTCFMGKCIRWRFGCRGCMHNGK